MPCFMGWTRDPGASVLAPGVALGTTQSDPLPVKASMMIIGMATTKAAAPARSLPAPAALSPSPMV